MTKKYFIQQAIKELRALKNNATKKELNKINFDEFDPNQTRQCIYGQMTGDCRNHRAKSLIEKICPIKVDLGNKADISKSIYGIKVFNGKLDGCEGMTERYLSFLEGHILRYPQRNQAIISWLKDETTKFPITINK